MIVEYRLVMKKPDGFEFSTGVKEQYKQLNLLCLDPKTALQNMLSKIMSIDLKTTDSNLKEIIRMIIFIREVVDLDKRILSSATIFNTLLIDLKTKYGLDSLITAYKVESLELNRRELVSRIEFTNKKISAVAYKYLNVIFFF